MTQLKALKLFASLNSQSLRFWLWLVACFLILWGTGVGLMCIADSIELMFAVGLAYVMATVTLMLVVMAIALDKRLRRLL